MITTNHPSSNTTLLPNRNSVMDHDKSGMHNSSSRRGQPQPTVSNSTHSVLVEGKLLSGDALYEYAKQKGLCPRCVQQVTHKRARKRLGVFRLAADWQPLTIQDEQEGNYTVYKGFCLQPTCYTLNQVQQILGEKTASQAPAPAPTRAVGGKSNSNRRTSHAPGTPTKHRAIASSRSSRKNMPEASISQSQQPENSTESTYSGDHNNNQYLPNSLKRTSTGTNSGGTGMSSSASSNNLARMGSARDKPRSSRHLMDGAERNHSDHSQYKNNSRQSSRGALGLENRSDQRRLSGGNGSNSSDHQQSFRSDHSNNRRDLHSASNSSHHHRHDDRLGRPEIVTRSGTFDEHRPVAEATQPHRSGTRAQQIPPASTGMAPTTSTPRDSMKQEQHHSWRQPSSAPPAVSLSRRRRASVQELPCVARQSRNVFAGRSSDAHLLQVDAYKLRKMILPDLDILQMLYENIVSNLQDDDDDEMWVLLCSRYESDAAPDSKIGQMLVLLKIIGSTNNVQIHEQSWVLLCLYAKQWNGDDNKEFEEEDEEDISSLKVQLVQAISVEMDRNAEISSRKYAVQALFALLKREEHATDSHVLNVFQDIDSNRRHHWIAKLLDMLMFQEEPTVQGQGGDQWNNPTYEILFVVWNLLLSQPVDQVMEEEDVVLLRTIVGINVSILSTDSPYSADGNKNQALLIETALGLLATVASVAGAEALLYRQNECLQVIGKTLTADATQPDVLLQGAHAMGHILNTYSWFEQGGNPEKLAQDILSVVMSIGRYQSKRTDDEVSRNEELSAAACRLLCMILESGEDTARRIFSASGIDNQFSAEFLPLLLRILETAHQTALADTASEALWVLIKCDTSASTVFEGQDGASRIVRYMKRSDQTPYTLENLSMIVAQLVTKEQRFGPSFAEQGGVPILGKLLSIDSEEGGHLTEAAIRALLGLISGINTEVFSKHIETLCEDLLLLFSCKYTDLELQLSALDLLYAVCARSKDLATSADNICLEPAVPVVVQCMENNLGQVDLLTMCCRVIRIIASIRQDWQIFVSSHAIRMIINAVLVNPGSQEFVMEAMATLKDFAANPQYREHFDQAEAEEVVTAMLGASKYNPEGLALAFSTLNNIVVDPRSGSVAPMQRAVLEHIVAALQKYPPDDKVSENASSLLQSYSSADENLSMMRQFNELLVPLLTESTETYNSKTTERAQYILCKLCDAEPVATAC